MRRYPLFLLLFLSALLAACSTPGAFWGATSGPAFKARDLSDESHVLVYFYRPQSQWADQELEAPGVFVNNKLIGSLPSNGYMVVEFEVASYQLELRRPLFGSFWTLGAESPADFTRIASFDLETSVGATYYLRFDEVSQPPHDESLAVTGDGPLQLVSGKVALPELAKTRRVMPFARINADGEHVRPQRGFWRGVGRALDNIGI